jgi:hypothetical protein
MEAPVETYEEAVQRSEVKAVSKLWLAGPYSIFNIISLQNVLRNITEEERLNEFCMLNVDYIWRPPFQQMR